MRIPLWHATITKTVTAVGEKRVLAADADGHELAYDLNANWIKVTPPTPLPELWCNVYGIGRYDLYAYNYDKTPGDDHCFRSHGSPMVMAGTRLRSQGTNDDPFISFPPRGRHSVVGDG